MPRVLVGRLKIPYPPRHIWMAETREIADLWQEVLHTRTLRHKRVKSREDLRNVEILDINALQYVVDVDQNCLHVDA